MVGDDDNDGHDVHSFDVRLIVTVIGPAQLILRDHLSKALGRAPGAVLHVAELAQSMPI